MVNTKEQVIKYHETLFHSGACGESRHANIALAEREYPFQLKNWKNSAVSRRFDALGYLRMHARDVNAKQRTRCRYLDMWCTTVADSTIYHAVRKGRNRCRINCPAFFFFFPPRILSRTGRAGRIDRLINPEASPLRRVYFICRSRARGYVDTHV